MVEKFADVGILYCYLLQYHSKVTLHLLEINKHVTVQMICTRTQKPQIGERKCGIPLVIETCTPIVLLIISPTYIHSKVDMHVYVHL